MSSDQGPDQVLPADDFVTLSAEGLVKLRIGNSAPSNYDPISVPGLFVRATKETPNNTALAVKRNGEWLKWTFSQYLKGTTDRVKYPQC
jgi:hypothetical protein